MNQAYPVERVRKQTLDILLAWGMSEAHAVTTADLMTGTDSRAASTRTPFRRCEGIAARAGTPFLLA